MLSKEQNEFITSTGPETPMGNLFRRYWIPGLLSEELPKPNCAPVRVKLLSERLLALRHSRGRLGLIDEFCAHRGASLWFGRNQDGGLSLNHPRKFACVRDTLRRYGRRTDAGLNSPQPIQASILPTGC